jgi:hypothetical protein
VMAFGGASRAYPILAAREGLMAKLLAETLARIFELP